MKDNRAYKIEELVRLKPGFLGLKAMAYAIGLKGGTYLPITDLFIDIYKAFNKADDNAETIAVIHENEGTGKKIKVTFQTKNIVYFDNMGGDMGIAIHKDETLNIRKLDLVRNPAHKNPKRIPGGGLWANRLDEKNKGTRVTGFDFLKRMS